MTQKLSLFTLIAWISLTAVACSKGNQSTITSGGRNLVGVVCTVSSEGQGTCPTSVEMQEGDVCIFVDGQASYYGECHKDQDGNLVFTKPDDVPVGKELEVYVGGGDRSEFVGKVRFEEHPSDSPTSNLPTTPPDTETPACLSDTDCRTGFICGADRTCQPSHVVVQPDPTSDPTPDPEPAPGCASDADCSSTQRCLDHACVDRPCDAGGPACAADQVCRNGACEPSQPAPQPDPIPEPEPEPVPPTDNTQTSFPPADFDGDPTITLPDTQRPIFRLEFKYKNASSTPKLEIGSDLVEGCRDSDQSIADQPNHVILEGCPVTSKHQRVRITIPGTNGMYRSREFEIGCHPIDQSGDGTGLFFEAYDFIKEGSTESSPESWNTAKGKVQLRATVSRTCQVYEIFSVIQRDTRQPEKKLMREGGLIRLGENTSSDSSQETNCQSPSLQPQPTPPSDDFFGITFTPPPPPDMPQMPCLSESSSESSHDEEDLRDQVNQVHLRPVGDRTIVNWFQSMTMEVIPTDGQECDPGSQVVNRISSDSGNITRDTSGFWQGQLTRTHACFTYQLTVTDLDHFYGTTSVQIRKPYTSENSFRVDSFNQNRSYDYLHAECNQVAKTFTLGLCEDSQWGCRNFSLNIYANYHGYNLKTVHWKCNDEEGTQNFPETYGEIAIIEPDVQFHQTFSDNSHQIDCEFTAVGYDGVTSAPVQHSWIFGSTVCEEVGLKALGPIKCESDEEGTCDNDYCCWQGHMGKKSYKND